MDRPYLVGPDELVSELLLGGRLVWLREWATGDQDAPMWIFNLRARCAAADLTLGLADIAKCDAVFAWNADLPSPPEAWFHATIDLIKFMRSQGGMVLPPKLNLMLAQQVPPGMLRRGPDGLRAVEPLTARPFLRPVD